MNLIKILQHCEPAQKLNISDSIDLVNLEDWNSLVQDSLYLGYDYLKSLEQGLDSIDSRYVLIYDADLRPVMAAYFPIVDIEEVDQYYKDYLKQYAGESVVNKLLPSVDLRMVLCGNLFVCGENGFVASPSIAPKDSMDLLAEAFRRIAKSLDNEEKASIMLVKELYPENDPNMDAFKDDHFHPLQIDCNMVLTLKEDWKSMPDYLKAMTSKFRTKANGVYKRSSELEIKSLNPEQILNEADHINALHLEVVDQAEFSLGALNAFTFAQLKERMHEGFEFKAYYLNGEMIGFSGSFICKDFLDAAHVGLNYEFNKDYALYQRMLYDFVELAMARKVDQIRFGRTAEQLKSSLGAVPVNMRLYIKHRNGVVNHLMKRFVEKIKPSTFELRKPFKQDQDPAWIPSPKLS